MRTASVRTWLIKIPTFSRAVALIADGFDLALEVALHRLHDSTVLAQRLSDIELQLFAAPSYLNRAGTPRTLAETARHSFVVLRQLQYPHPLPKSQVRPRIVSDDMLFVEQAVKAGLGLGLLTPYVAEEDVAAGRLLRVLPKVSIRIGAVYLVHPPTRHVPKKVTAFRDHLMGYLKAHPIASATADRSVAT